MSSARMREEEKVTVALGLREGKVSGKPWWILVGGRQRLGRVIAEGAVVDHNLVLTSSRDWGNEGPWLAALSTQSHVKNLSWDAANPGLVPSMMADLDALRANGITLDGAVILSGSFPDAPFGTWTAEDLAATWRLNLSFPFLVAQALAPHMREGSCLQLILDTAIHRPWSRHLPYSAAKAGLAILVPGLAKLLAPRVRVVGHALGVILPDEASDPAALREKTLLKRNGEPEDLMRAIRFAADSPYLTGDIITLDGGRRWI